MKSTRKPIIFISSTVYGIEELLERIYTLLTNFGYEVWLSHTGTVPVFSNKSAFDNCITAVKKCDLFLGLITPYYGSGIDEHDDVSITHKELRLALELKKPRWLLSHDHVVFARSFLDKLGYRTASERKKLTLTKSPIFGDLRVIDMYEEAVLSDTPLRERQGNWVQKYKSTEDALVFTTAQFSRFQEVEAFIKENLSNPDMFVKPSKGKGAK
ncbi:MAG: DUF4062 domain-containing protein [Spirochaetes bacterium]|nr:DUF4062 domain-containing protein [Spirochaetota bacterium]MBN2772182.1 DUF4062 domain-containing protein [Spirochaetota bacterium]